MSKEENIILPALAGLGLLLLFSQGDDNKPPPYVPGPGSPTAPTDFIRKYWNEALLSQKATTIPALFTITQAGLESAWGKSAPKFNFFGIKDSAAWKGATQTLPTKEYVNGKWIDTTAKFRAYGSAKESFEDHGKFFIVNPRYKGALKYVDDNIQFAKHISKPIIDPAYATDPDYADKLITAMKLVVKLLQSNKLI